ncbi:Ketoacyl-synthetase C-terminal extension, partial [Bradyrhizobium sp. OK095]
YGIEVPPSVFFSHPTLAQLTDYLVAQHAAAVQALYQQNPSKNAEARINKVGVGGDRIEARTQLQLQGHVRLAPAPPSRAGAPEPIAIIGMSGRFPKARTVEDMWQILAEGEDAVEEIPFDRFDWRKYYGDPLKEMGKIDCKWGGFVPEAGEFDPLFFEISPREAELMDPRQRLLLMEAWKALETAGYGPIQLGSNKIGTFVGAEQGDYQLLARASGSITSNHDGILASRLAYFLNMRGPAMAINTACSSGLVALHQACLSLRNGECDTALAAGVNLMLTPQSYVGMSQAGMLSKDGQCHVFDRNANGMVPGEAVAVVVLKRLSQAQADGDPIKAVIRGSGVNYDGKTNGITAPSGASQSSLLREVYDRYQVKPDEIEYIVTHGTGTRLGDPIEINALSDAFRAYTQDRGFCALTSSKTNFGHTLAASGLVSLIGLVESLRHGSIPPSLHCEEESDYIDWRASPFYVNKARKPWPEKADGSNRLGAVSAFGMSGTNAHVVVESYRSAPEDTFTLPCSLLVLSAKTEAALRARVADLIALLEKQDQSVPDLWAMSHTLLCGRQHFDHRCAVVIEDRKTALYALRHVGGGERLPNQFQGTVARNFAGQTALQGYGEELLIRCDTLLGDPVKYRETLCALAELYCQGYDLTWHNLHASTCPRRMSLPTYPFAKERYWIETAAAGDLSGLSVGGGLPVELHRDATDSSAVRFTTRLGGDTAWLRTANGVGVVPESWHLDVARAAVAASLNGAGEAAVRLEQVEWLVPVMVGAGGLDLHVEVFAGEDGGREYEISSGGMGQDRVIHSRGYAFVGAAGDEARVAGDAGGSVGTLLARRVWEAGEAGDVAASWSGPHFVVLCGGDEDRA